MKTVYLFICLLACQFSHAQNIAAQLDVALKNLETDNQFKHAILGMYVVDTKTGKPVFEKNAGLGLAPASCQKIITSATAFELLGKNYRYQTKLAYDGSIKDSILTGNLYWIVSGDPTLASWRWPAVSESLLKQNILAALKAKNITRVNGDLIIDDSKWESQATPGGWVWEDVGNYFGAGARGLNWHENQYDLILRPGKNAGDPVDMITTRPELQVSVLVNELKTGKEGSGDQSVIYLPENGQVGFVRGRVPAGNKEFVVKGSIPNPTVLFIQTMKSFFKDNNIQLTGSYKTAALMLMDKEPLQYKSLDLLNISSPTLDSINYWFLKKSINLFGEAFVKTIAYEKNKFGATDSGLNIITDFWKERGIESSALHLLDGSGLSPANRITPNALVTVLQYARKQDWFSSFYNALPEMNSIKMKDGFITGVRSYTGYVKSRSGIEYSFSFIVNNYDGNAATVREKMWKVLDILK